MVLLALATLLHFAPRSTDRRPAAPPDVSDPEETIAAFAGELPAADGGWLIATLAPLHFDARRQAFDRGALERRLALPDGEPWRLSLRWEAPRLELDAGVESGEARQEGSLRLSRISLKGIQVEDEQGLALAPLPALPESDEAISPLCTLLAPPTGSFGPGQTVDWILWGRAPGLQARLAGLPEDADGADRRPAPFQGPLDLRATRLRRADLGQPLARLDRELAGKNQTSAASGTRDGAESR